MATWIKFGLVAALGAVQSLLTLIPLHMKRTFLMIPTDVFRALGKNPMGKHGSTRSVV